MVDQPGLDNRHRDKNGQISRKHGNTLIGTLRRHYGAKVPTELDNDEKLEDVLARYSQQSLSQMLKHHREFMELLHREHDAGTLKTT
jgi:hypothetical protein